MKNEDLVQTLVDMIAAVANLADRVQALEEHVPLEFPTPLASGAFQAKQMTLRSCVQRLRAKEHELRHNLPPQG